MGRFTGRPEIVPLDRDDDDTVDECEQCKHPVEPGDMYVNVSHGTWVHPGCAEAWHRTH